MGIKNFLELFQFREDEEFEDEQFEDDDRDFSHTSDIEKPSYNNDEFSSYADGLKNDTDSRKVRAFKVDRANSKIVPIKSANRSLEVCIMKPSSFGDSQDICDMLSHRETYMMYLKH